MKNLIIKSTLLLLISANLFSCKKEQKDEVGAEQPTTHNLGNGIIETVQRGPNGNNVIFSNWITKTSADWTGFGTGEIKTDINTTSLTDAVANQGLVLIYFNYADHVYLLPYVRFEYQQVVEYSFIPGKMTIALRITNGGAISDVADLKFRYVLIPNSAFPGSGSGKTSQSVDYNNYNAVCEYYGIQK